MSDTGCPMKAVSPAGSPEKVKLFSALQWIDKGIIPGARAMQSTFGQGNARLAPTPPHIKPDSILRLQELICSGRVAVFGRNPRRAAAINQNAARSPTGFSWDTSVPAPLEAFNRDLFSEQSCVLDCVNSILWYEEGKAMEEYRAPASMFGFGPFRGNFSSSFAAPNPSEKKGDILIGIPLPQGPTGIVHLWIDACVPWDSLQREASIPSEAGAVIPGHAVKDARPRSAGNAPYDDSALIERAQTLRRNGAARSDREAARIAVAEAMEKNGHWLVGASEEAWETRIRKKMSAARGNSGQ